MKKVILGLCVLGLGIGSYFYFSSSEEKGLKPSELSILEKVERSKIVKNKPIIVKTKAEVEIVKGYKLPPEPDKALNDSTLLGIDSNNNMLRDDVERWIMKQNWSDNRIAASFQKARGFQLLLNEDMGDHIRKSTLKNISGDAYKALLEKELHRKLTLKELLNANNLFSKKVFNTKERQEEIKKYNKSFSGTIIHSFPPLGKHNDKYADFKMESGKLEYYEFVGEERYYSDDKIPLYARDGLINSYWNLEKNKVQNFEGDWDDKYCEINFGIEKNGLECSNAEREYNKRNLK